MACQTGFQEWTFDLTVDGAPAPLRLTFCMKFDGFLVSGKVFDPTFNPAKELSYLTGLRVPTPTSDNDVLSLEFMWDQVRIFMAGFTFIQSKDRFEGRFMATALTDALNAPNATSVEAQGAETSAETSADTLAQVPPDPGDTGTGNGTQT